MSPTDMIEDPPADKPDRVLALERAFEDMKSDKAAMLQLMQTILQRLGPEPTAPVSPPRQPVSRQPSPIRTDLPNPDNPGLPTRRSNSRRAHSPIPTSTAGRPKTSLRPSIPPDFDGDRSKGKAFLTSCRTYIRLCPEAFDEETTKIVWAMSYMRSGRAGRWAS
jgi:hypothetical protein